LARPTATGLISSAPAVLGEPHGVLRLSLREATDVYYRSRLGEQVAAGLYGIDNLDYKYLANDLIEHEPELFR